MNIGSIRLNLIKAQPIAYQSDQANLQIPRYSKSEQPNKQFFPKLPHSRALISQHRSPVGMSSRLKLFGCVDNPVKPYVG